MRLSNFWRILPYQRIPGVKRSYQFTIGLILASLLVEFSSAATTDVRESHLISPEEASGQGQIHLSREIRSAEENERSERGGDKQVFRLELLRQIKAIDHMKCFPKVLCGLSVDTDNSFGVNKSNFVRSYLELMRNIKPIHGEEAEDRIRTEAEVEEKLIWPFSPHNPDRKHHSSFERVSSAALSASVEMPDSSEYISRGLESKMGDTSISMEKGDRMGMEIPSSDGSMEFKEKLVNSQLANSRLSSSLSHSHHATYGSIIPGDKKTSNSNKSLTAKLTSYFSSWLPGSLVSFGGKSEHQENENDDSFETEMYAEDRRGSGRSNGGDDWKLSEDALSLLPELWEHWLTTQPHRVRKARADESSKDPAAAARDSLRQESTVHDGDIYHTAVNIGKRLKDPKQCDYIYNGCPLEYNKILDMIGSIRTEIHPHDGTADAVSFEFGMHDPTTTTTTTTTTTKRPQKKKPRPSTKIMHTLPNGEKVEINFRLVGGSEESDESSSAQREYGKKDTEDDRSSFEKVKTSDEVVVVDLGQRSSLSTDNGDGEKRLSHRKGSPMVDTYVVKNKHSNKKKMGYLTPKRNIMAERRNEDNERSEETSSDTREETSQPEHKKSSTLKLSGLTLSTANNKDEPLEISPSYVIIKHQPLSVHTTSVMSPDGMHSQHQQHQQHQQQQQQQHQGNGGNDQPRPFQLVQNGQQIDAGRITDELKNYIRRNGGVIPKLSLHSSGLITTDGADPMGNKNPFNIHRNSNSDLTSAISQQIQQYSNPMAGFNLDSPSGGLLKISSSQVSNSPFSGAFPGSPMSFPGQGYSSSSYASRGPAMVSAVPGRMETINQPASATSSPTTTTTTTSTTTEKMLLPGMAETVSFDTDEVNDDTLTKLESEDPMPSWMSGSSSPTSESMEGSDSAEDDEQTILENLNKALLSESSKRSKIQYKNTKKKKMRVKANTSRVRPNSSSEGNMKRNKGKKKGNYSGSYESSAERVVIKHAGPYSSSPTVYKSPLIGPGPHGGAYPYLPGNGMRPSVFPGNPFWRY